MMGSRHVEQAALFYEFSIEQHVPPDHPLRSIEPFVDLADLRSDLTCHCFSCKPVGRMFRLPLTVRLGMGFRRRQ